MKNNPRTHWIYALFFCFSLSLNAQNTLEFYKEKFPKENAVLLMDETKISITVGKDNQLNIVRSFHEEKMLLNNKAGAFSERSISFSHFYSILDVKAKSLIPKEGKPGKYKKYKVKDFKEDKVVSRRVFHDDVQAVKFKFPNLREGAVTTLQYSERINNPFFLPPVLLQDNYFAEKIRVVLEVPEDLEIKITHHNAEKGAVEYTKTTHKGITTHVWEARQVEGFKGERSAPHYKYFVPHVSFAINSFTAKGNRENVLSGVQDLYGWYSGLLDSVNHELTDDLLAVVDSIDKKHSTPMQKTQAMFDWVRGSIKYIAVEYALGGFIPDDPSRVAEKRYGDCKGMSCLLANMLRKMDIEAYECWIGTRDIPYQYNEIYTPIVDNHMITAVKLNDTWYFLDPTDKTVPFGFPSSFIQGKEALIGLDRKNYLIEKVPVMPASANVTHTTDTLRIVGDTLRGSSRLTMHGYDAADFKRRIERVKDKERFYNYFLETGHAKFKLDKTPEPVFTDSTLTIDYKFTLPDYIKQMDQIYFINLNLERILSESTFENRKLPIENDNKFTVSKVQYLKIPKGYHVHALPDDFSFRSDLADVDIVHREENGYVRYELSIISKRLMIEVEEVEDWNKMVKQLRMAYRNNIELTNQTPISH